MLLYNVVFIKLKEVVGSRAFYGRIEECCCNLLQFWVLVSGINNVFVLVPTHFSLRTSILPSLARVLSSGILFQSNFCNLFLPETYI